MLRWVLKFLVAALAVVIVVYVCKLLLGMVVLPEPAGTIVLLIIGVAVVIVVAGYLGFPPGGPGGDI